MLGAFSYHIKMDQKKSNKAARLIVRNLPFKCNEESVHEHFSEYGEVLEVNLLKKQGRLVGCGFVQFDSKGNAAKAILSTNGKTFLGRQIIVDWAVPKDKFHTIKCEKDLDTEVLNKKSKLDNSKKSFECHPKEEKPCIKPKKKFEKLTENKTKFTSDNLDGKTVFFKDIPFQANNDDLRKCAEEITGPIEYAVICMDPLTEHSRGTGFVRFKELNDAEQVLNNEKLLVLFGKTLLPYKALQKNELENKKSNRTNYKDNRNLYLIKEGTIVPGSTSAKDVSQADMNKRLFVEQVRSKALKNLHKFISPTRLIVYNLPFNFDNKKLLNLFKMHSPKGTVIAEARVMRNLKQLDDNNVPKSKGYGFVSFDNHENALIALRSLNNNPKVFSEKKRPIVVFSVENRAALLIKKRRKEKQETLKDKINK